MNVKWQTSLRGLAVCCAMCNAQIVTCTPTDLIGNRVAPILYFEVIWVSTSRSSSVELDFTRLSNECGYKTKDLFIYLLNYIFVQYLCRRILFSVTRSKWSPVQLTIT